jgi:hypothetical protein
MRQTGQTMNGSWVLDGAFCEPRDGGEGATISDSGDSGATVAREE